MTAEPCVRCGTRLRMDLFRICSECCRVGTEELAKEAAIARQARLDASKTASRTIRVDPSIYKVAIRERLDRPVVGPFLEEPEDDGTQ